MQLVKNENGYYEVRVKCPDGKRKTISTHRKNKEEAKDFLSKAKIQELEQAAELGILNQNVIAVLTSGRRTTVQQAISPWKDWLKNKRQSPNSIANAETWVTAWMNTLPPSKKQLMAITGSDIDAWINNPASTVKLSTRRVMLSAIRSFYAFVSSNGWCIGNPSALVNVDPFPLSHEQKEIYRQPIFTDDDIAKLMVACHPRTGRPHAEFWSVAIPLSQFTGLRLSDIASLEWACLSNLGRIAVWTRKRDRRVELPLDFSLSVALLSVAMVHPKYLFPEQREIACDPKRRAILSTEFRRLCQVCGISGKSFHGLRATAATNMAAAGVPISDIASILGHAHTETSEIYVRPELANS